MASNHTTNYGLSRWEPGDAFVRTEFNGDNERVDAALHGLETEKAGRDEVEAVAGTAELKCRMRAGTYRGDSATLSQRIEVGFPVKAVLVERPGGNRHSSGGTIAGLALLGCDLGRSDPLLHISGTGFTVYNRDETTGNLNSGDLYYIAWG